MSIYKRNSIGICDFDFASSCSTGISDENDKSISSEALNKLVCSKMLTVFIDTGSGG